MCRKLAAFMALLSKCSSSPRNMSRPTFMLYGEYMGEFNIRTLEMIEGDLPKKAQELVTEWLKLHQTALQTMWDEQKIGKLPPL